LEKGIAANATARRFRRKVSCEMQTRLPAQTTTRQKAATVAESAGRCYTPCFC
jgi:hypothetical protein